MAWNDERKCENCGDGFIPNSPTQQWCPKCKEVCTKEYRKMWYQRNKKKISDDRKAKKKKIKKLSTYEQCAEIERQCRELGIDYGTWVVRYDKG